MNLNQITQTLYIVRLEFQLNVGSYTSWLKSANKETSTGEYTQGAWDTYICKSCKHDSTVEYMFYDFM